MENQDEMNMNQHPIKWGAILGLISVIITLAVYMIDVTIMVSSYIPFVLLAVFLAVPIYAGRDYRTKLGGYISFKDAFLNAFVILLIGGFIGTVFDFVLYNYIDPDIIPLLIDVQMENTMKMMETLGSSSPDMIDKFADGLAEGFTLAGQAKGFLWKIVLFAIGAVIVGAINKKKNKEEEEF